MPGVVKSCLRARGVPRLTPFQAPRGATLVTPVVRPWIELKIVHADTAAVIAGVKVAVEAPGVAAATLTTGDAGTVRKEWVTPGDCKVTELADDNFYEVIDVTTT